MRIFYKYDRQPVMINILKEDKAKHNTKVAYAKKRSRLRYM
jgi:hypothetical protein